MSYQFFLNYSINYFVIIAFNDVKTCLLAELVKMKARNGEEKWDKNGILVNGLTIVLILAGTAMSPILVLSELDPQYLLVQVYMPSSLRNWYYKVPLMILRLVWIQALTLEASRIYLFVCIPTTTVCSIYLRILAVIGKRPLTNRTVTLYNMLQCINQICMKIIATVAGTLMGFGLFIFIIGNWIVIKCWDIFPLNLYCLLVGVLLVVYFILFQTVPLAVKVNQTSANIIRGWKREARCKRQFWKRQIWALQPVAFYYAFTKYEKGTTINFYFNIVNYTINVLLLY